MFGAYRRLFLLCFFAVLLVVGCGRRGAISNQLSVNGPSLTLLDFAAPACQACQQELKELDGLLINNPYLNARVVRSLSIVAGPDPLFRTPSDPVSTEKFRAQFAPHFTASADNWDRYHRYFPKINNQQVGALPAAVILDQDGNTLQKFGGGTPIDPSVVTNTLLNLLTSMPPRLTLLDFAAPACQACQQELKQLDTMLTANPTLNARVVRDLSIVAGPDPLFRTPSDPVSTEKFRAQFAPHFTASADNWDRYHKYFPKINNQQVGALPAAVVLDEDGNVLQKFGGGVPIEPSVVTNFLLNHL